MDHAIDREMEDKGFHYGQGPVLGEYEDCKWTRST